jgi:hypothetical protein
VQESRYVCVGGYLENAAALQNLRQSTDSPSFDGSESVVDIINDIPDMHSVSTTSLRPVRPRTVCYVFVLHTTRTDSLFTYFESHFDEYCKINMSETYR